MVQIIRTHFHRVPRFIVLAVLFRRSQAVVDTFRLERRGRFGRFSSVGNSPRMTISPESDIVSSSLTSCLGKSPIFARRISSARGWSAGETRILKSFRAYLRGRGSAARQAPCRVAQVIAGQAEVEAVVEGDERGQSIAVQVADQVGRVLRRARLGFSDGQRQVARSDLSGERLLGRVGQVAAVAYSASSSSSEESCRERRGGLFFSSHGARVREGTGIRNRVAGKAALVGGSLHPDPCSLCRLVSWESSG